MSQDNQQFVAPTSQEMVGDFAQPSNPDAKVKLENLEKIGQGVHPGIIFAVVDLGTHPKIYNGVQDGENRMIFIGVEYPQLKQLIYEGDTEPKPLMISKEMTYYVGGRAGLKTIVEAHEGRAISDEEGKTYNVGKLLGSHILTYVVHNTSKSTQKVYENIKSFLPIGDTPLPMNFQRTNDFWKFYIDPQGLNFTSLAFANLPNFLKKKIMASKEGMAYAQKGGKFAEKPKNNNEHRAANPNDNAQRSQNQQPSSAPQREIEMVATDYTYEQYIASGWSVDQLISTGKAKYKELPQAPAPAPAAPSAPAPQGPPAPTQQTQAPQGPAAPQGNGLASPPDDLPF